MTLKPRLMAIVEDIRLSNVLGTVYDIGTDHALLPIFLIKGGICKRVVATDISCGPLQKAAKNIRKHGVTEFVSLHKGDGFEAIPKIETGSYVIISGVGGVLLTEILEKGSDKAKMAQVIALQPMNNVPYLRQWLNDEKYRIIYEKLAVEDRRVYNILFCEYSGETELYSAVDYLIGKRFANCHEDVINKYADIIMKRFNKINEGLSKSKRQIPSSAYHQELTATVNTLAERRSDGK